MTDATATDTPAPPRTDAQAGEVEKWVDEYRKQGYQPLPSDPTPASLGGRKKPLISFAAHWESPLPGDPFNRFGYRCNVQVMTGSHWRLLVVDLDGPEAEARWAEMLLEHRRLPRTWEVRSGSGGRHLWFTLPAGTPPVQSGRVWSIWDDAAGDWKKHVAIERLADRKLAMAPPSLHPKTGRMYRWIERHSPYEIARPAPAPEWLVAMPVLQAPRKPAPVLAMPRATPRGAPATSATTDEILAAIPDLVGLAGSWGLRFAAANPNSSGWISCHAAGRDDRDPSASFSVTTGRYWDPETGRSGISLFDLAARLGAYHDPRDARDHLAATYLRSRSA